MLAVGFGLPFGMAGTQALVRKIVATTNEEHSLANVQELGEWYRCALGKLIEQADGKLKKTQKLYIWVDLHVSHIFAVPPNMLYFIHSDLKAVFSMLQPICRVLFVCKEYRPRA